MFNDWKDVLGFLNFINICIYSAYEPSLKRTLPVKYFLWGFLPHSKLVIWELFQRPHFIYNYYFHVVTLILCHVYIFQIINMDFSHISFFLFCDAALIKSSPRFPLSHLDKYWGISFLLFFKYHIYTFLTWLCNILLFTY